MRVFPHNSPREDTVFAGLKGRLAALDDDRRGAVLLLCLAAILILLMLSWVMVDGIFVTHDKGEAQASADMAAYSDASVKARSMNMMAFTNVGKRSIVGAHTMYRSMYRSYASWVQQLFYERCDPIEDTWDTCDDPEWVRNRDLFDWESDNDYSNYESSVDYYVGDLRALDNYQQYLQSMTPWWAWTEAVLRAQRNGATLATSFRPPNLDGPPGAPFQSRVNDVVNEVGAGMIQFRNPYRLPVEKGAFWGDMVEEGMMRSPFIDEHQMNVDHHRDRSEHGAAVSEVLQRGSEDLFEGALSEIDDDTSMYSDIAQYGSPMRIWSRVDDDADWLMDTSTLVLTYHHNPKHFGEMAEKYDHIGEGYRRSNTEREEQMYRPRGYWGMARAEISYQHFESPDLWRPAWTARMRPVALPGEFHQAGFDFSSVYRSSIDFLLLSAHLHDDLRGEADEFFNDLVYMERASRAMGQSTIEGISR